MFRNIVPWEGGGAPPPIAYTLRTPMSMNSHGYEKPPSKLKPVYYEFPGTERKHSLQAEFSYKRIKHKTVHGTKRQFLKTGFYHKGNRCKRVLLCLF